MADTLEAEFVSKFHSLSGTTIKERTRNFNKLLNTTGQTLQHTHGKLTLSSLVPTTPLEESFKLAALLHFKCVQELLDVFKSENPIIIEKLLKQSSWFIPLAFKDISGEYLATQLFPTVSYNTKVKLLNNLSAHLNNVQKAEQYFEAVKEHYGYYLASKLLAGCGSDLIIKCIDLYKTEITPGHLLLIVKRYPNLTELILEKIDQQNAKLSTGEKYKNVFKYLTKTNPKLFIKLFEKYSPEVKLGSKETDTFIKQTAFRSDVKLGRILKTKQIGKSMGDDFKEFFYENFPKRIVDVNDCLQEIYKLLSFSYKDSEKYDIFSSTFKKIYGNDIWEYPDLTQTLPIEWMSPTERTSWMIDRSRPSYISEDTWISYYTTDKSIPLIKEKIMLTFGIKSRSKFINALLKTCNLNKDNAALLDILQYINSKHRNENSFVIREFLTTFNNLYKEHQLTENHWNEVFQCVQLFILNKGYNYYTHELLEKCILFRLSLNLPIKTALEFWAKHCSGNYNLCLKKPRFQKQCLIELEGLVPLGYKNEDLKRGYVMYLYSVQNYNEKHPNDKIVVDIKDEYVEAIKQLLETDSGAYDSQGAATLLILQDCRRAEKEGVLELYFKQDYYSSQITALHWLIKEQPLAITKYFKYIVKSNSYQNWISRFIRTFCTKYTHLDIPQMISKLCYEFLVSNEDDHTCIKTVVVILSLVATPQQYLQYVASYFPKELTPNLESDVDQTFFIKQQAVAEHFRNVTPITQLLDGILAFCKGDYLKFVYRSVDIAATNVAENKLIPFLAKLQERAVSVRKHAIFLSSRVLNKTLVNKLLLTLANDEKNTSLRKVLFKTAFRNFLNDSSESAWEFTKQLLSGFDASDAEAFVFLTTCTQIPIEYFSKYLEYSWNIIEKCTNKQIKEDGKLRLLNFATSSKIAALQTGFCTTLLEQNLFKCEQFTDLQGGIHSFACRYIIYGPGGEDERLETVFRLFDSFKSLNRNDIQSTTLYYKLILNFIKQFCDTITDKKCTNRAVFNKFYNMWVKILPPSETFVEFVYLELTLLYLNVLNEKLSIGELGLRIASLCNLLDKENCLIGESFSNCLNTYLSRFYDFEFIGKSDENDINVIKSIVNHRNSPASLEVAVYLLPTTIPLSPIIKEKYDYVVDIISKEMDHRVQVIFHIYLRNVIIPTK